MMAPRLFDEDPPVWPDVVLSPPDEEPPWPVTDPPLAPPLALALALVELLPVPVELDAEAVPLEALALPVALDEELALPLVDEAAVDELLATVEDALAVLPVFGLDPLKHELSPPPTVRRLVDPPVWCGPLSAMSRRN